jgi:hypothetical protein
MFPSGRLKKIDLRRRFARNRAKALTFMKLFPGK